MDHYMTQIHVEELRHLSNVCIVLKQDVRTNLLLTGKNGSGKTTVLQALKKYLMKISDTRMCGVECGYPGDGADVFDGVRVEFNDKDGLDEVLREGSYILAYYGADRKAGMTRQHGAEDVVLHTSYAMDEKPGDVLLKYLVHLKTQQAYARNEKDQNTVDMLDKWFERFTGALRVLLDDPSIQVRYDYKNYNFEIIEEGRNPFGFDELSDGYSAAIQIVADLILRMEQNWLKRGKLSSYDAEGIALIDELETHLHIGLQKTILPFLTSFFPRMQFVVSTHSPYILNSVENCVIYDLERKIRMENMSGYSAEGIVEMMHENV